MNPSALVLGAVAYDSKVVAIWDGFQQYFTQRGLPFDYVLFTNYERQVEALLSGQIDVAWNSPLAWLQTERVAQATGRRAEAICMRDTDRDLTSIIIVRRDSDIHGIEDLKGKKVGVGAPDSPQATLIPLCFLAEHGLEPHRDFTVTECDLLRGKHGDHIGGERQAARLLMTGECDAACLIDANHLLFVQEATIAPGAARILAQTPVYDHCNFTVLDGAPAQVGRFRELLLEMSYADSQVRPLLDLEGLKRWLPGRTDGYASLARAVERFRYLDPFVEAVSQRCI